MVIEDIKRAASELEQESSFPAIGVELVDNELAVLYMNSKKSEVTYPTQMNFLSPHKISILTLLKNLEMCLYVG